MSGRNRRNKRQQDDLPTADDFDIAEPEDVIDEDTLVVPLKRKIKTSSGTELESVSLRYPNRADMKILKRIKDNEAQTEKMLELLAEMPPEDIDKIAQSDFMYITKKIEEAGFFGIIQKKK